MQIWKFKNNCKSKCNVIHNHNCGRLIVIIAKLTQVQLMTDALKNTDMDIPGREELQLQHHGLSASQSQSLTKQEMPIRPISHTKYRFF